MSTARALFVVFSLFVAPACLVGKKVNDRNVLHFNLKDNSVGYPGGLVRKADSSLVLYEVPKVKSLTYDDRAQFNLGRATLSTDLVTWQLEDDFLDGTKLSLPPTASILAGDILERSGASADKPYVVAYGIREENKERKIHTRSVGKDFVVDPKEKGYEAEGVTPSLFEMNGKAYVAYVPWNAACRVQIAEAEDGAEVTEELDLSKFDVCEYPRIVLLEGNKFAVIVSSLLGSFPTAYYAVGDVVNKKLSTEGLKFNPFDAGRYANYFTLFKNSDGTLTTVGWNGNKPYGSVSMGLTLLRNVTYDNATGLFKQEPLIGKPTKSSEWNVELKARQPQGEDFNLDEGALVLDMTFQDAQNKMMNNVVEVTLSQTPKNEISQTPKNENNDNLIVIKVNPTATENTEGILYQLTVDLKGIEASSIEKAPEKSVRVKSLTGTLKIIVDKSTIEVYGEDGLLVLTESYRLKDGGTLSQVNVTSLVDLKLIVKLHSVRVTVKPTDDLTPSDLATTETTDDLTPSDRPATTETATAALNPKPTTGNSIGAAVSHKTSGLRAVSSLLLVFLVGLSYILSN